MQRLLSTEYDEQIIEFLKEKAWLIDSEESKFMSSVPCCVSVLSVSGIAK